MLTAKTPQNRAMSYNGGFRDGAYDAARGRFAVWYRTSSMNPLAVHFDGDYAYGYHEGRNGWRVDGKRHAIADLAAKYRSAIA